MKDNEMYCLIDSAVERPDTEPLTEDEQLAMMIYLDYTDNGDMLDYETD